MPPDQPCKRIVLYTPKGRHPPSFKNRKRAIKDGRTGKLRTLTEPDVKKWMEKCINSFEFQLSGIFRTGDEGTHGGCQKLLPIASFQLFDDSLAYMIPGEQSVVVVPKGEERAEIFIERIQ